MKLTMKKAALVIALIVGLADCFQCRAQTGVDRDLAAEIARIKAIDNHAHPLKYVADGQKPDDEYDALPLEAIELFPLPVRLSPENKEFIGAWASLYGYTHKDMNDVHVKELLATKQRMLREQGAGNPA